MIKDLNLNDLSMAADVFEILAVGSGAVSPVTEIDSLL